MTSTPATVLRYLDEVGGTGSALAPDPEAARSLPVFVCRIYEPYRGQIFGQNYALLICRAKDRPTPGQVEKHAESARSALGTNVAFVFPVLSTYDRKRLIQRRIPFIVPGRQAYLPMVMIDLRERSGPQPVISTERRAALTAPAQSLLLFYLQRTPGSGVWKFGQWADALGYTRMTLSRSFRELVSADLCRPHGRGRTLMMQFPPERRALWEKALPYLRSPVARQAHIRIASRVKLPFYLAGVPALGQFTMIAAGHEKVFALSSAAYRSAIEDHKLTQVPYGEEDTAVVQRWRYDPGILSPDGHAVDRLSLYLSLQHDPDERVQGALKELLETISW